jgi:uncharacterized membrane protein YqaE (UPF0057 family)
MGILLIILAIFLPPLAVFLTAGLGFHFWINILLTILGRCAGHDPCALGNCEEERELGSQQWHSF